MRYVVRRVLILEIQVCCLWMSAVLDNQLIIGFCLFFFIFLDEQPWFYLDSSSIPEVIVYADFQFITVHRRHECAIWEYAWKWIWLKDKLLKLSGFWSQVAQLNFNIKPKEPLWQWVTLSLNIVMMILPMEIKMSILYIRLLQIFRT